MDREDSADLTLQPAPKLLAADIDQLHWLRERRIQTRRALPSITKRTLGESVSDTVAAVVGSWPFIIIQSIILGIWITFNVIGFIEHWDPYPFILLNLVLSFQAAYTAPIIMMSQNRQAELDRADVKQDYDINLKAELEIELLHQKIDLLRETEITKLIAVIEALEARIDAAATKAATG